MIHPAGAYLADDPSTRADALIARLEGAIALTAAERVSMLGRIAAPGLVEPHRDHHAYALGADQADCELAIGDARAMRGLMSIGPTKLAKMLTEAAGGAPTAYVTRLWPAILATDRARFVERGKMVDAKRLKIADDAGQEQRSVFEAALARSGIVDGHRDQHAFVLGSDLFYCGLVADDAVALLGLMSIGPTKLAEELRYAGARHGEIYVGRLWPWLLAARRDDYEARGRLVRWQRRWTMYNVEFEAWLASPRRNEGDWRGQPMSARQRHLVRDTAILLSIDIPEGFSRGDAHDWLAEAGANTLFIKDK